MRAPPITTLPLAVMLVADALVSVVCPVTFNVPFEVSDEVAVTEPPVIVPPVSAVKNEVTPCMMVAIRPVVVVVAVMFRLLAKMLPEAVMLEVEAFESVVCPVVVRFVTVVVESVEVPLTVRVPPTVSLPVTTLLATVLLVVVRLVIVALVVVELPTIKLVILATVARREEKNPLVEVELVIVLLVP